MPNTKAAAPLLPFNERHMIDPRKNAPRAPLLDQFMLEHAIRSLDRERITECWRKMNVPMPDLQGEFFWAVVHRTRLHLIHATAAEKRQSEDWLRQRGYDTSDPRLQYA